MVSTTKTSEAGVAGAPPVKRRGRRCPSSGRTPGSGGQRPWMGVRPMERQLMRPWLQEQIDGKEITGLAWLDPDTKTTFRVPWKHGSRQGWNCLKDACLFRRWAQHTGRYRENEHPNPKRWKANFRCAINSLPDAEEVKRSSQTRGHNAFRVYRFLEGRKPKKFTKSTGGTSTPSVTTKVKMEPDAVTACMDTNDHAMVKAWFPDTPESLAAADSDDCPDGVVDTKCVVGVPTPPLPRTEPPAGPAAAATPSRYLHHQRASSNLTTDRGLPQPNLCCGAAPVTPRWMHLSGGCVQSAAEQSPPLACAPTTAPDANTMDWTTATADGATILPSGADRANYAAYPAAGATPCPTSPPSSATSAHEFSFHFAVTGTSISNRNDSASTASCSSWSQGECRSDEEMYDSASNFSTEAQSSDMGEVLDELFPHSQYAQQASSRTEGPLTTSPVANTDIHNNQIMASSLQDADVVAQDDPYLPGITNFLDLNFHIFINTGGLSGNEVAAFIDESVSAALAR